MTLCVCQGHILDDRDLVETLQASKGMSVEMHMRVQNSRLTEQELNAARKKYLSVSDNLKLSPSLSVQQYMSNMAATGLEGVY